MGSASRIPKMTYVGKVDSGQITGRIKLGEECDRQRVNAAVLCVAR